LWKPELVLPDSREGKLDSWRFWETLLQAHQARWPSGYL